MDDPTSNNAELSGLAAQLAALVPCAGLDRDRLMFAAGQRAMAKRLRIAHRWLAATGAACGILLAALLLPTARQPDRFAERTSPAHEGDAVPKGPLGPSRDGRGAADTVLAMRTSGSTNFRLQRLLERDVNASLATDYAELSPDDLDREESPAATTRALLYQYLENGHRPL